MELKHFKIGLIAFGLISGLPAFALTTLKQVHVSNGTEVALLFDGKIAKGQVKTEFFNDIIQVSLTDVSVYPAKISSINGNHLTKIFAYQYAPKLVRCRLTVKGNAEDYKDRVLVSTDGKVINIKLDSAKADEVKYHSAQATRAEAPSAPVVGVHDAEERALMDKVLKPEAKPLTIVPKEHSQPAAAVAASTPILGGAKRLPAFPYKALGTTVFLMGFLGLIAVSFRRMRSRFAPAAVAVENAGSSKIKQALGRFAQKSLGRRPKLIEVIATHHLGPKKSIAVVNISGRKMVLGISNDAINLIAQLPSGTSSEEAMASALGMDDAMEAVEPNYARPQGVGATSAGPALYSESTFSEVLGAEKGKPSVRSQIRSRLEGMKPL